MKAALEVVVLVFGGLVAVLLAMIVGGRAMRDRRAARAKALRPAIERAVADYLVDAKAKLPPTLWSKAALRVLQEAGVEGLTELRGSERRRLTRLLEAAGVVRSLQDDLRSHRHRIRRAAVHAMAEIESQEAAASLLEGLSDHDLDVRAGSALALAELGDEGYVRAVAQVLDDMSERRPGAVDEILIALASANPSSLRIVLDEAHSDRVRARVTAVVGSLRLPEFAPLVRPDLSSENDERAALAARAAGLMGDMDAFDRLLSLAVDGERGTAARAAAAEALGELGDERAIPALEQFLRSENWALQHSAARALSRLGEAGEGALHRAAADSTGREHALAALTS